MSEPGRWPRVRVDEETANILVGLLERERVRILVSRAEMQEDGVDEGVTAYNRKMRRIARLQNELARTMKEWGWLGEET